MLLPHAETTQTIGAVCPALRRMGSAFLGSYTVALLSPSASSLVLGPQRARVCPFVVSGPSSLGAALRPPISTRPQAEAGRERVGRFALTVGGPAPHRLQPALKSGARRPRDRGEPQRFACASGEGVLMRGCGRPQGCEPTGTQSVRRLPRNIAHGPPCGVARTRLASSLLLQGHAADWLGMARKT